MIVQVRIHGADRQVWVESSNLPGGPPAAGALATDYKKDIRAYRPVRFSACDFERRME